MLRRDVLLGDGDRIAALTDGLATIGGTQHDLPTPDVATNRKSAATPC
jgi:hypothetical protein